MSTVPQLHSALPAIYSWLPHTRAHAHTHTPPAATLMKDRQVGRFDARALHGSFFLFFQFHKQADKNAPPLNHICRKLTVGENSQIK